MVFVEILKTICIFFDWLIYSLVVNCYVLFAAMCEMNIDSIGKSFVYLTDRIKVFIGIIMLFVVVFNLLQMLVDPDKAEQMTSKLVQKVAISVVLLVAMNYVFTLFNDLQNIIISNNVVQTIILGPSNSKTNNTTDEDGNTTTGSTGNYDEYVAAGKFFSYNLLFAFVTVDDTLKTEITGVDSSGNVTTPTKTLYDLVGEINEEGVYYRYPVISGACGILLGVIFVTFAIDIGVRAFTLIILQVIAPIPIIAYIIPGKDSMLSKYFQEYIKAFVELFLKIAIVYITLYLMKVCMNAILLNVSEEGSAAMFPSMADAGTFFKALLLIVVIVSLFYFARKFPKLIGSLFGVSFDSNIDPFKTTKEILTTGTHLGVGAVGGAVGGVVGASAAIGTGAGLGAVTAGLKGIGAGAQSGYKSKNIKDFVSGSVGQNFKSQRQYAKEIGNKGGLSGVIAQRANKRNERAIAGARANLETISKGEELRKSMRAAAEKSAFDKNSHGTRTLAGGGSRDFNLTGFDTRESYVSSRTASARKHLEDLQEAGGSTADIQAAAAALEAERKAANADVDFARGEQLNAEISSGSGEAYDKYVEYQAHAKSNSDLYEGHEPKVSGGVYVDDLHDNLDSGAGIRSSEQIVINDAITNPTAVKAAQAQARGAENARRNNSGDKK